MKTPKRRLLTETEAREREERLLKAGLIPERQPPSSTITLLQKRTPESPPDDDDESGVVE